MRRKNPRKQQSRPSKNSASSEQFVFNSRPDLLASSRNSSKQNVPEATKPPPRQKTRGFDGFTINDTGIVVESSADTAEIFRDAQMFVPDAFSEIAGEDESAANTTLEKKKGTKKGTMWKYLDNYEESLQSDEIQNILDIALSKKLSQVSDLPEIYENIPSEKSKNKSSVGKKSQSLTKKSKLKKAVKFQEIESITENGVVERKLEGEHHPIAASILRSRKIGFRLEFVLLPELDLQPKRYPERKTKMLPLQFWNCERIVYQKGEAIGLLRRFP